MPKYTEKYINLFGQDTPAPRCQAKSKRSQEQCKKAAIRDKDKCRMHGGVSTGPRTAEGRNRCAAAKTVHGCDTRKIREIRAVKFREMNAWFKAIRMQKGEQIVLEKKKQK